MYFVIELQTNKDGTTATLTHAAETVNQGWSKYHNVLQYAAVSELPFHSAVLMDSQGNYMSKETFEHEVEGDEE